MVVETSAAKNLELLLRGTLYAQVRKELAFFAGVSKITAVSGESIRATFENPVGNSRDAYISHLVVGQSFTSPVYAAIHVNPDTGLPASSAVTVNSMSVGSGATSNIVVKGDAGATDLSGGTDTGVDICASVGRNQVELYGMRIPPGVTLGLNVPLAATAAANGSFSIFWWEE